MNASRKILKNVTKKGSNVAKSVINLGERSVAGRVVESVIVLALIIFTAVVLKYLPNNFLCWFNHIVVKIIFLIVIAFVALYSPPVGLMLAILLVSLIQMCQRKQLSQEIDVLKVAPKAPQAPTQESMQDYLDPEKMIQSEHLHESYSNQEQMMQPQGFNENSACLANTNGINSGRQLDGMCGNVITWNGQISAQGLNGPVVGPQESVGYPVQ